MLAEGRPVGRVLGYRRHRALVSYLADDSLYWEQVRFALSSPPTRRPDEPRFPQYALRDGRMVANVRSTVRGLEHVHGPMTADTVVVGVRICDAAEGSHQAQEGAWCERPVVQGRGVQ